MYLWSSRCAANEAQLQPRVLYPFFVPSPASLPGQNLSRALGSLIGQPPAPGGPRSREMRRPEAARCSRSARPGTPRPAPPPPARPSPGLGSGLPRRALAPHLLPASCPSPPNELLSGLARARPEVSRQFAGPSCRQARLRAHSCLPSPTLPQPATPRAIPRRGLRGASTILLTGRTPEGQQLHLLLLRGL